MMADLRDLYQEVIVDHGRRPRNFGPLPGANHRAEGFNPLCGDRLTLQLQVVDGVIRDARFEGAGCAISTASASLMTEALKGRSTSDAEALFYKFPRHADRRTAGGRCRAGQTGGPRRSA